MLAPCKGCNKRILLCHSTCERYKAYRKECDRQMALRAEKNMLYGPTYKKRRRG